MQRFLIMMRPPFEEGVCFDLIRVVSEDTATLGKNLIEFIQGLEGTVKLLGGSRELGELDGERAGGGYAASVMPQTSCHASKARARSAR